MKIRKRIWALLLAAALMTTLLPAMAFAEDSAAASVKPVSVEWNPSTGYTLRGVIGTDEITNLDTPDIACFTVTYSDNSKKDFVYKENTYKDDEIGDITIGLFYDEDGNEALSFYPFLR